MYRLSDDDALALEFFFQSRITQTCWSDGDVASTSDTLSAAVLEGRVEQVKQLLGLLDHLHAPDPEPALLRRILDTIATREAEGGQLGACCDLAASATLEIFPSEAQSAGEELRPQM